MSKGAKIDSSIPYEDPSPNPSFVRTTREYLRNANIKSVNDGLKRSMDQAVEKALKTNSSTIDVG